MSAETLVHIFIFLFSGMIIWFFAGTLIESVDRVARRFQKAGFTVAFFILGLLTSISELSVATNALVDGVPQVSIGNLVGASFIILLLIIPLLAIAGNGIELKHTISRSNLILALAATALPSLLIIDGAVTKEKGAIALLVYITLVVMVYKEKNSVEKIEDIPEDLLQKRRATLLDAGKILVGAIAIFVAGHFLVKQSVYFSNLWHVPKAFIGLLFLSIGTNVPEIVIAIRAILKKHKDIAFGDYLGSAASNTLIFGLVALIGGDFSLNAGGFLPVAVLTIIGFICFYVFALSKHSLSKKEGVILLLFTVLFFILQGVHFARFN